MNKVSLIVSGVLVIAVAYLFYQTQQLTSGPEQSEDPIVSDVINEDESNLSLAFVRGDSIMLNYKFVQIEQDLLISKARNSEIKIERELKKAEKESQGLIEFVNSGQATQSDAQVAEQTIRELEYSLAQLERAEQQKISKLEAEFQRELYDRITKYLKKYGEENGIDMVFNFEPGGQTLLYSSDVHDVTAEVIVGLNAEYEIENAPEVE